MHNRLLISISLLFLSSCATYQSEGLLSVEDQTFFQYEHAAISPETHSSVRGSLAQVLESKGPGCG